MGLRTLSPAHQQRLYQEPDSFVFIISFPLPQPYNLPLHWHFCHNACCQQVLVLSLWLQVPGRRISVSLHLQGTRSKVVSPIWKVALGAHEPWAPLSAPEHHSSQESAPRLVQQFCVEGPISQFSQPLKTFQWGYQCHYKGKHFSHGAGP